MFFPFYPVSSFSPFPEHILFFLLRSIAPVEILLQILNSHDLFLSVMFYQDNKSICASFPVFPSFESNQKLQCAVFYSFTTSPLEHFGCL